jgi:predicted CopG family antitoxin
MFSGKTITITQEAYNALIREKKGSETLSEVILRLTKNNKQPQNYLGIKKTAKPEDMLSRSNFDNGWYSSTDLL